jgi:hypothetical protein
MISYGGVKKLEVRQQNSHVSGVYVNLVRKGEQFRSFLI